MMSQTRRFSIQVNIVTNSSHTFNLFLSLTFSVMPFLRCFLRRSLWALRACATALLAKCKTPSLTSALTASLASSSRARRFSAVKLTVRRTLTAACARPTLLAGEFFTCFYSRTVPHAPTPEFRMCCDYPILKYICNAIRSTLMWLHRIPSKRSSYPSPTTQFCLQFGGTPPKLLPHRLPLRCFFPARSNAQIHGAGPFVAYLHSPGHRLRAHGVRVVLRRCPRREDPPPPCHGRCLHRGWWWCVL